MGKVDIPKNTLITFEMAQLNVRVYPKTNKILETHVKVFGEEFENIGLYTVFSYMHAYGYSVYFFNGKAFFVDGSIMTFVNHGCDSTDNLGGLTEYFVPEVNDELKEDTFEKGSEDLLTSSWGVYHTNPVNLRHVEMTQDFAKKDINAGD